MRHSIRRLVHNTVIVLAFTGSAAGATAPPAANGDGSPAAFTGLAQAPEANLFVGAATTAIKIDVPPGRKELTPNLSLAYSSSAGASAYGFGWDLTLGKIQRCGKRGVLSCSDPTYRNEFVLVLPNASLECQLNLSAGERRARPCVPAIQESYIRVTFNEEANQWDVWDKSGVHYSFGTTANERSGSDVNRLFTAGSPCAYTFSWSLNRIADPNGNILDIVYSKNTGVLYPEQIAYGANLNVNQPHLFEVNFIWSDEDGFNRPQGDEVMMSNGGFPATLKRLLSKIEVRYRPNLSTTSTLVRRYGFLYDFQTDSPDAVGRQSQLSAVTVFDGSGMALARSDGSPASTTFLYQRNAPDSGRFGFGAPQEARLPISSPTLLRYSHGQRERYTTRDLIDMNGDGFTDLVESGYCDFFDPSWLVYLGSKNGFAATPVTWTVADGNSDCPFRVTTIDDDGSWMKADTFDINGDGIPDQVSTSISPYAVALGRVAPNSEGGYFEPWQRWSAPDVRPRQTRSPWNIAITIDGRSKSWSNGTVDVSDFIDVNGDGLVDLVSTPHLEGSQVTCSAASGRTGLTCQTFLATASTWLVWFNTGYGFAATATPFPAGLPFLRYSDEDGQQAIGLHDITGDGLIDQILAHHSVPNAWMVYQHTGYGMALGGGDWRAPDECGKTGIHDEDNHRVTRDLFDINADGLVDLVTACGNSWLVRLNRGAGFAAQALSWSAPFDFIRDVSSNGKETYRDSFDIDGDGMIDFVDFIRGTMHRNLGGAWLNGAVSNLNGGKPDTLVQIENGIGGTTTIDYQPSTTWDNTDSYGIPRLPFPLWTVTRIEQDDGMCDGGNCRTAGSHTLSTNITYAYGLYDNLTREFRGFRTVRQSDPLGHRRETYFHQDGARKGKARIIDLVPAAAEVPIDRKASVWVCAISAAGAEIDCPEWTGGGDAISVRLKSSSHSDGGAELRRNEHRSWDSCGNVTETVSSGLAARPLTTRSSFTCSSAPTNAGFIFDRPVRTWSIESAGSSTARTLEEKWFQYDSQAIGQLTKGNLTKLHTWLDGTIIAGLPVGSPCPATPSAGGGSCLATSMGYDNLGNVTAVTDANGASTHTRFDTATYIYPDLVLSGTTDPRQQISTSYDPKCGKLQRRSSVFPDASNTSPTSFSETIYDSFCRPREVWEPYPGGSGNVKRRVYGYYLSPPNSSNAPVDIAVGELVGGDARQPSSQIWTDTHQYSDALGRLLQTNRRAVVSGSLTYVVDGLSELDARGKPVRRYAGFTSSGFGFVPTAPAGTGSSSFEYDALGRVTRSTNPDGSYRTTAYSGALQTTTSDECYTSGSCAGSQLITLLDGFGRAIEGRTYQKASGGTDSFVARTATTYDGLGRSIESKQGTTVNTWNEATKISTRYDSLGRRIQTVDPDSGTWMYGYDRVGNLIYQDDPAAEQHIQLCYDGLNRLSAKHYVDARSGPYVAYQSNRCSLGNAAIQYTYGETAGASFGRLVAVDDESGLTVLDYDVRGRTISNSQTISVAGLSTIGAVEFAYDAADHPTAITYPDGEVVNYTYNGVGQVMTVRGAQPYLTDLTYDLFGRPLLAQHGNGFSDVRAYGNALQNYRQTSLQTKYGNSVSLAYNYDSFTKTGMLARLTDIGPKGSANAMDGSCSFTYDGIGRLTGASGPQFSGTYAYDALGNLTSKEGMSLAYAAAKPHTLEKINGSSVGLNHDPNGNRTGKPGQTYNYTGDDRVRQINAGGALVEFLYDYQGQRVAKIEPGGRVTRYYGNLAEAAGEYVTKYYYAGDLLIASNRVWAPQLARHGGAPPIQVAQLATDGGPGVLLLVRGDWQQPLALSFIVMTAALLIAPWRRKAIVGVRVRHGHVVLTIFAFVISTLPVPWAIRAATAATVTPTRSATFTATRTTTVTSTRTPTRTATRTPTPSPSRTATRTATGSATRSATFTATRTTTRTTTRTATRTATRTTTRTATVTPSPTRSATRTASPIANTATRTPTAIGGSTGILHYHLDHLGSVHAISDNSGSIVEYIRYKPYGEVRGHYDRNGNRLGANTCNDDGYCREFTGYDSEPYSGLQYANARVYDPQLGTFLTHDPARQFASPYTYTNGNPINAADPSGAELTLLAAVIIGIVAGALANGIQAAINGASVGNAFKAAAIGGALGGLASGVGYVVLQPALQAVTSTLSSQLASAGVNPGLASSVANLSVYGTAIGSGVAQASYNASRGDYSGLIGLAAGYALGAGWDALNPDNPGAAGITEFEVRPGDVLATNEGTYAKIIAAVDPTGDTGHTQLAVERKDGSLGVLTSDAKGQRVANTGDAALSGRGYDVYRTRIQPSVGSEKGGGGIWSWIKANATGDGLLQYLGNAGGNVCSSTCNSALVAGNIPTGLASQSLVTPNQLVGNGSLVYVGRLPHVP